jgi:coenzyme F420-0:L-glutamate ligase/coenzyme F420-1:gamma-L-glutamate ligase
VLVIAQKIVSKAEGRAVRLADVTPSGEARELAAQTGKDPEVAELILRESSGIMRAMPGVVIARHRLGMVAANAGIDACNVENEEGACVLLWPTDPDASAAALRDVLSAGFGTEIAVIISDSLGRAWRLGTTGMAIGVAGITPLTDRRGETDLFGRTLQATVVARADELAAAASLVIGEAAEATPVAIIRNAPYVRATAGGIGASLRPADEDLFP